LNNLKHLRDLKNVIDTSRQEGEMDGIQKGIEKGINQRNIEIAKELLKNDVDLKVIMKSTGLSKNEIENLK